MKEIFSAFGSEVFRPVMTILLPGLVAVSTWVVGLLQRFSIMRSLAESRRVETGIIVVLAGLAIGEILEDLGSHIETKFDDIRDKQNPLFKKEWYDYLSKSFEHDPIGRGYIRSLVIRLKFEFGLSLGLCVCAFGVFSTQMSLWTKLIVAVVLLGGSGGLRWEARQTHLTLQPHAMNFLVDGRIARRIRRRRRQHRVINVSEVEATHHPPLSLLKPCQHHLCQLNRIRNNCYDFRGPLNRFTPEPDRSDDASRNEQSPILPLLFHGNKA